MTERHPNLAKPRSSMKPEGKPYIPSNPSRSRRRSSAPNSCTSTGIADPYSPNKQRPHPTKTPSQKLLQRTRSIPPRDSTTHHSASLDDVTPSPPSRRSSRWESSSQEASTKSTGMAMPTRRRGVSPSPDENDTTAETHPADAAPAAPRRSSIATSTPALKQLRRKLSGSGDLFPSSSNDRPSQTTTTTNTTLQSAMHVRRTRMTKPRRHTSPARQKMPTLAMSSSSLSNFAPIDIQSDEEDDHVFVRRSNSNEPLLFFQEDESPARTRTRTRQAQPSNSQPKDHGRRRSDVGPLRIPTVFANDAVHRKASSEVPTRLLHQLELASDELGEDDLDGLVRALDKQSEDHAGHIFCSARNLLSFADDDSDDDE